MIMKKRLIAASIGAAFAELSTLGLARETVNLPVTNVFGAQGQLNGVDTTGSPAAKYSFILSG